MTKNNNTLTTCLKVGATLLAGVALGATTTKIYQEKKHLSSKKILEQIKEQFAKEGEIEVSYIEETAEEFSKFALSYQVLRGGIIRLENGQYVNYEFLADLATGTVVDITRSLVDYQTIK